MTSEAAELPNGRSISESLAEYGRGLAGGLIFSLPLIYTMEVWDAGASLRPERLLVGVGAVFLLLLGYNRYAGLRHGASPAEVLIDSVEELGLGLLVAALTLWLLGQIRLDMRPGVIIGAVVLEGLLAAIGVSVGTAQLGGGHEGDQGDGGGQPEQLPAGRRRGLADHLVLGVCGAVLIATNVAPTEEITLIAGAAGPGRLLGMVALGLFFTTMITFFSEFVGTRRPERPRSFEMLRETMITYMLALLVAAALLWFFNQLDGQAWPVMLARVIVLSIPAALGASAGRLLLQGGDDGSAEQK